MKSCTDWLSGCIVPVHKEDRPGCDGRLLVYRSSTSIGLFEREQQIVMY